MGFKAPQEGAHDTENEVAGLHGVYSQNKSHASQQSVGDDVRQRHSLCAEWQVPPSAARAGGLTERGPGDENGQEDPPWAGQRGKSREEQKTWKRPE